MAATSIIPVTLTSLYRIVLWIHMIYDFHGLHFLHLSTFQPDRSFVGIINTSLIRSRGRKSIVNVAVKIAEEGYFKLTQISISSRSVDSTALNMISSLLYYAWQITNKKMPLLSERNKMPYYFYEYILVFITTIIEFLKTN